MRSHWRLCVAVAFLVISPWAQFLIEPARQEIEPVPEPAPKLVAAQTAVRMDVEKDGLLDSSDTSGTASGDLADHKSRNGAQPEESSSVAISAMAHDSN